MRQPHPSKNEHQHLDHAMKNNYSGLVAFASIALAATSSSAALVAYDGFFYPTGSVLGRSAGLGFVNAWSAQTTYGSPGGANVVATSLTYLNLNVQGGALEALPNYEFADRSLFSTPETTGIYYLSFLIAKGPSALADGYGGLSFWGNNNGGENGFLGYGGTADVDNNTTGPATPIPSTPGNATLLVYKMNLDTGIFNLFVNPTVGDVEPLVPNGTFTGPSGGLQSIGLNSEGGYLLDEIRLGTTFADVTPVSPVPEPSTALLTLCGLTTMVLWRRRKTT